MASDFQFVLDKMEEHRLENKTDLEKLETAIFGRFEKTDEKIDVLWGFRLRILGASAVAAALVGGIVSVAIDLLRH